jgi:hypothetical protein
MLKKLATILVLISCIWTAQGQVSLPFRQDAPIPVDLYWTKAFDLMENQRLGGLEELLEGLINDSSGLCAGFDQNYEALKAVISARNKANIERALTEFITRSIVFEIYALNTIKEQKERKTIVINLFKELIAIQKYIKSVDFDTYRQLVNCFRRLNQLYSNPDRLQEFIDSQKYLSKYKLKC